MSLGKETYELDCDLSQMQQICLLFLQGHVVNTALT